MIKPEEYRGVFVSVTGSNPHFAPQNRPCQAFAGGGRYFVPCGELPLKIALRWGFAAKNRCTPVFLGFLPIFTQSGGVTKFYDVCRTNYSNPQTIHPAARKQEVQDFLLKAVIQTLERIPFWSGHRVVQSLFFLLLQFWFTFSQEECKNYFKNAGYKKSTRIQTKS